MPARNPRKRSRAQAPTLAKAVKAIRRLKKRAEVRGRRFLDDLVEIGKWLSRTRDRVGHGNWLPWLRKNFNWSGDTAANYMRLYELSQTPKFRSLRNLPLDLLYLLARKSFPEPIRDDIADRIERGEPVNARQEIGQPMWSLPRPRPRTSGPALPLLRLRDDDSTPSEGVEPEVRYTQHVVARRAYGYYPRPTDPDPALDDSTPSEGVPPEFQEIQAHARETNDTEPPIDRYEVLLAAWHAASEDERARFLAKIKARLLS
jgi:hypothetical protein